MKKRFLALLVLILMIFSVGAQASSDVNIHTLAFMDIKFNCGCTRYGTGTMIGRYGLITAAHNLYCPEHGQNLKSCSFAFGSKSLRSAWYRYTGRFSYTVYDTFRNGYKSENDIGYVIFDSPVGNETGWQDYIVGTDFDLNWEFTHVYTYDNKAKLGYLGLGQEDVISSTEVKLEGYLSGAEGGPVTVNYGDGDYPDYLIVAVYTSHDSSGNGYGRRITQNVINDMRADGAFR